MKMKPSILSDEREALRQFQLLPIGTFLTYMYRGEIKDVQIKISKNRTLIVADLNCCEYNGKQEDITGRIDNHAIGGSTEFLEVAQKQIQEFFK